MQSVKCGLRQVILKFLLNFPVQEMGLRTTISSIGLMLECEVRVSSVLLLQLARLPHRAVVRTD